MALSSMRCNAYLWLARQMTPSAMRRPVRTPLHGTVTTATLSPDYTSHRFITDKADKKKFDHGVKKQLATQAERVGAEGACHSTPMTDEDISTVARNDGRGWFDVAWKDGYRGRYPYVWMRDNCRCSECFYQSCHSRSMLMANLDLDVKPLSHDLTDDGRGLKICWSDGHTSSFPSDWLKLHRFDKTDFDPIKKIRSESWGSEFTENIPTFRYEDVLSGGRPLMGWLEGLIKHGLVLIQGAPKREGVVKAICDAVGYQRITAYGPSFRVESLFEASNLAYTSAELGLHVDLPFYEFRPGVQMLHCVRQCETEGGDNQFVDAYRVAETLRREEPELYEVMTKVKLDFRMIGKDFIDFHLQQARTLIELDANGDFETLAYNDQVRSPYINVPVEEVGQVYKALKTFHQAMYCKDNFIKIKLKEGETIAFNNNRVLHGRTGYTVSTGEGENKSRLLEGGYLDWDEVYSRMRLLNEELNGTPRL